MRILVVNCGSSSLKLGVFDTAGGEREVFKATYDRFDGKGCRYKIATAAGKDEGDAPFAGIEATLAAMPGILASHGIDTLDAVGHRVVHGGERFRAATVLDDGVIAAIEALNPLAPLHNPANLNGIRVARQAWPQ